jgi:hypothetical protein
LGLLLITHTNAQTVQAGVSEIAPPSVPQSIGGTNTVNALFTIQFDFFPDSIVPTIGCVGVVNTGTQLWISRWSSNTIFSFDYTGTFIDSFAVAGVTGTRSMTFDGTYVYLATNTQTLKKVNPVTRAVVSTINLPLLTGSTLTNTRWATYDATLNSGAGGFWIGNYSTDILSVSMTGTLLSGSLPAANHLLGAMYGAVVDNVTAGGPYIWANNQQDPSGSGTGGAFITQLSIATGMQTGVMHSMATDYGYPDSTKYIAGGITITTLPGQTQPCLFANYQGFRTTAYELTVTGLKKMDVGNQFRLSPNPSSKNGVVKINYVPATKQNVTVSITDVTGKTIYSEVFNNVTSINKSIPVNNANGVYTVNIVNDKGEVMTKKLVVE